MKNLTTLLALLLSCSMLAQGPVEFPWNPDADGDDFIGVNDLMALLGEFDSVFSEEALYLSEDSLSAMYDAGDMNYVECLEACSNLPGTWKIPRLSEVTVSGEEMWLQSLEGVYHPQSNTYRMWKLDSDGNLQLVPSIPNACFCVTKERPKVEYSFCDGADPSHAGFTQCINEKLAEGWYPLSGFPTAHHRQGYGMIHNQTNNQVHFEQNSHAAFWRWVE